MASPSGAVAARDLPQVIPVFPLNGALLLPHASRPFNIFEPRYLNMLDDAMAAERIIGMIQTVAGGALDRPRLLSVGCAGRVTSFAETSDGRYLITLTGVARFRLGDELPAQTPYRRVRADFAPFAADLDPLSDDRGPDHARLAQALRRYLERQGLGIAWEAVEEAPLQPLVNSLAMALPFDPGEQQALLEAADPVARCEALIALLQIKGSAFGDDGPARQ